jgi:hypothetical protein
MTSYELERAYATRPAHWGTHACSLPDPAPFDTPDQWLCPACDSLWNRVTVTEPPLGYEPPSGPVSGGNPPHTAPTPPPPRISKRWTFIEPRVPHDGAQLSDDGRFWLSSTGWRHVLGANKPPSSERTGGHS